MRTGRPIRKGLPHVNDGPAAFEPGEFDLASDEHPLELAARFAQLAPSPRNSQPWRFVRDGEDKLLIYADTKRGRAVADPENRELLISCGVAFRFVLLALESVGYRYAVTYPVDRSQSDRIATIRLTGDIDQPNEVAQELVLAAAQRHTNWGPFFPDSLNDDELDVLRAIVEEEGAQFSVAGPVARADANALIDQAHRVQMDNPDFVSELQHWPTGRPTQKSVYAATPAPADSAGTLVLIFTADDTVSDWITAGRALGGMLLVTTGMGLSNTFMNQPLQVDPYRAEFAALQGITGYPQQLVRVGKAISEGKSPQRRDFEEVSEPLVEPW